MKMLRRSAIFLTLLFVGALPSLAQTGSISGTVSDASGAVVAGTQVTATNNETGIARTAQSSTAGTYTLPSLPVGQYSVTFNKAGFRVVKFDNVSVTVAQTVPLNAEFQVGNVQETVTVSGVLEAPVETESSQLSSLVESRRIEALPLLTRNPYELVLLSPGTSQTNSSIGGISVNGSRERNNNFLLDGVDNNDTSVPGILGGVLSSNPDSTEEFRVITNSFDAEFGRNTGAIVDVVTKSGTNSFHGDAYWFGRYNGFGGARDWFNREGAQDPYVRNQFGYSFGGPIRKNKTFFFFNEEFQRFRTTLTNSATVPTQDFKNGVFNFNGNETVDLRPGSANNPENLPADPTMQAILALYPNPTQLNSDGYTGQIFFPSSSQQDSYQTVAKIDHHFNDKHSLSMRYGYDHFFDPNLSLTDFLPGGLGALSQKAIAQAVSANLASAFTPSLLNTFTFGWNHIYSNFACTGLDTIDGVSPLDQFGNGRDYVMNPFTSFGCLLLVSDGQYRKTGTTSYTDSITWSHGAHTWKFGGDFRNVQESGPNSFYSRRYVDTRSATNFGFSLLDGVPDQDVALADAASAYWGFVVFDLNAQYFDKSGNRQPVDNKFFRQHEYDGFAQDTWKVRPNLTLNLGLRYQFNGVPYEEDANFSNLLTNPWTFPDPVTFTVVGPGTGHQIYNDDYSNIEPRVGFSWDPRGDGKTAVRGAFGIFHDRVFGNLFGNARGNPPFEQDYTAFPFQTLGNNANLPFSDPTVPAITPEQIPSTTVPNGANLAPVIFDTHFRNSSSNNWNLGIQHEFAGNLLVDLNYVGSKGTHIYHQEDGTPPDPTLVADLVSFCSDPNNAYGCTPNDVVKGNLFTGAENGVLPFDAIPNNALVQPFFIVSDGNSNYNALQAKITRRMSHGLEVQGSYTFSHALDDTGDPLAPALGNRGYPRNSRKLSEEYGNSDNDVRHVATISYIWEMPIGRGKSFMNSGFVGRIFEGIQFSGITSLQTGHPFDVFSTTDSERTGLSNRADLNGDPYTSGANSNPTNGLKAYLTNPDAFAQPDYGRPGNIGRNHLYGPGFVNFDLAFSKKMKLTERVGIETRVEGYNIFNHPHFSTPGSDANASGNQLGSSIFGFITSTSTRPDGTTSARQMQVAMKLTF